MATLRFNALLTLSLLACSSNGGASDAGTTTANGSGGQSSTADDGGTSNAGANNGGASNAGANQGASAGASNTSGGQPGPVDASVQKDAGKPSDAGATGVSCDRRKVFCRIAEPQCPAGEVVSVEGTCFGPCVKITACVCDAPDACPHDETYTCWNNTGRCNYYGP